MDERECFLMSPSESSPKKTRFVVSSIFTKWSAKPHLWEPPTDVFETNDSIVVQVEIAGMKNEEFIISLERRELAISGVRPYPAETGAYYQMEIASGEFLTVVELPYAVNYDEVEAEYQDGFLRVILPKASPSQVHVSDDE